MRISENSLLVRIVENSLLVRIFESRLLVRISENSLLVRIFENSLLVRIFENMVQIIGPFDSVSSPVWFASPLHLLVTNFSYSGQSYLLLRQTQNFDVAIRTFVVRRTTVFPGSIYSVLRYLHGRLMQGSHRQWHYLHSQVPDRRGTPNHCLPIINKPNGTWRQVTTKTARDQLTSFTDCSPACNSVSSRIPEH